MLAPNHYPIFSPPEYPYLKIRKEGGKAQLQSNKYTIQWWSGGDALQLYKESSVPTQKKI